MTRRPAITAARIRALKALADTARPRLAARVGTLCAFASDIKDDVRKAIEFIDAVAAYQDSRHGFASDNGSQDRNDSVNRNATDAADATTPAQPDQ